MRLKRTKNQGSYSKEKRKDLAISGEEKEKGLLRGEELFFKNIPMKFDDYFFIDLAFHCATGGLAGLWRNQRHPLYPTLSTLMGF